MKRPPLSLGLAGQNNMPIKINGTELTLQPTTHGWIPKVLLGTGGAGHGFYAPVQEYELNWEFISTTDLNQVIGLFNAVGVTGTVTAELPQYGAATYTFYVYSGCVLNELELSVFFEQHTSNARLLISNIRV
jgi:hypothetical protein